MIIYLKELRLYILLLFLIPTVFLASFSLWTNIFFSNKLSSPEKIMNNNNTGLILLDRTGKPFFTFYQPKNTHTIPLSKIPKITQEAVISAEDKNFYHHFGFSPTGILRSIIYDIAHHSLAYGGSTITQQLVKNALLNSNKNLIRKFQEIIVAQEIENRYSKDQILAMYLNSVYFGNGAFGIENAAENYFGKPTKDLDLAESSMLAAILPAPSALSPIYGNLSQTKLHQKHVLDQMVVDGYITQAQESNAFNKVLVFNHQQQDINNLAPDFALMVKNQLIKKYGEEFIARSGFVVTTTLDTQFQRYAQQSVNSHIKELKEDGATNGASVVEDPQTGEILALVGSIDWNQPGFGMINMATTPRQPGSSFKPIIYGEALSKGMITAATVLQDIPTTFPGDYKPVDYDHRYRGPVLVRRALANSLNIPAVEVLQRIGLDTALQAAKSFGITTLNQPYYGFSLVLGAGEVPLTEMTGVYATLANQGIHVDQSLILNIKDKNNNIIYKNQPNSEQTISPQAAFILTSILSDPQARHEEFGNLLDSSIPQAVKTGTSDSFKDSLTFGYTPDLAIGVWVGNDNNSPMDGIAGSLGAAPIERDLITKFSTYVSHKTYPLPPGIIQKAVCRSNGLLLQNATSSGYLEYFIDGTEPTRSCNLLFNSTPSPLISIPPITPLVLHPSN